MAPFTAVLQQPAPFDTLAESYDEIFTETRTGRAQRASVWRELDRVFKHGQRILEINCGTGVDALRVAGIGARVVACDASSKMIDAARNRVKSAGCDESIELRVLATERLEMIKGEGIFDGALSNFAGLNCVEELSGVSKELARLLKPGAKLVICVFGRWCAWEILWYLARINPRKAFRRIGKQGATVQINGNNLRIHYPSPRSLKRAFAPYFRLMAQEGVGILVPPTYLDPLANLFPGAMQAAAHLDRTLSGIPFIRSWADHTLLTFERAGD